MTNNEQTEPGDGGIVPGDQFRVRLFGEDAVRAHLAGATQRRAPELNELTDQALFGGIWQRPGLPLTLRSLVTIAAMAALGHERELEHHLRAGLALGWSAEELKETILQLAFYTGLPAAHASLRALDQALQDSVSDAP